MVAERGYPVRYRPLFFDFYLFYRTLGGQKITDKSCFYKAGHCRSKK